MYSAKMETCAWALGIQASVSAQTSLLDPADACTVVADTNTDVPPDPLHPHWPAGPPTHTVRLCFVTALGVTSVVIAAPNTMRVPFGIVRRLSCLAWTVSSERWPC